MNLLVNGFPVKIEIVPFESKKGFILFILPKDNNKRAIDNLSEISQKLRQSFFPQGGMMDNLHEDDPGEQGYQLRLLGQEPLIFIDMVRMLGYSVRQEVTLT